MKRILILHSTTYEYAAPVEFGTHRAMLRPREGHELHIESLRLTVEPEATVRWLRDAYDNSVAVLTFREPSTRLHVASTVEVDLFEDELDDFPLAPTARTYPFQYASSEQLETMLYRLPSYPHDGPFVRNWLADLYTPGQALDTLALLDQLNTRIFESFRYERREEPGVQLPCETLSKGSGSCRDFAVFMMEAARHLGFASRFVTGYIQMHAEQHGATHAWTDVYLPGAGWWGYDPTNNKRAGTEHVTVGVARDQSSAAPLSGSWSGPSNAFQALEVSVQVVAK